jgi:hypothetical protein
MRDGLVSVTTGGGFLITGRAKLPVRVGQDENGKAQNPYGAGNRPEKIKMKVISHFLNIDDEMARQGRDGDIDEKLDRQSACSKINADHGPEFEIDKQQQDIFQGGVADFHHANVVMDAGPDHGRSNPKERNVVKNINENVTRSLDGSEFLARDLAPA